MRAKTWHGAEMVDDDDPEQHARTRYAVIAAAFASFAGEAAEDGTVGGLLDPQIVIDVLCEVIAGLTAKSGQYSTSKQRWEFANQVRRKTLVALNLFIDHPELLDTILAPLAPLRPGTLQ